MKTFLTILGCGSSMGVPRADGFWGSCDKNNKKNYRTRCSVFISKGNNNILIDTSPDLRFQLLKNKIRNITMHGNPQTFVTGVGLYNDNGQLLATARLSSPLKKNFASEATIKVKLTY